MATPRFNDLVSKYKENDPMLKFEMEENLARLEKQSGGDSAFYFLSIISFIEGYLRDKYKSIDPAFQFDTTERKYLSEMFRIAGKEISNVVPGKVLSGSERSELGLIYKFMRIHSNGIHSNGKYDTDKCIWEEPPTEFYIDGDRIRHCFCKQDDNNVRVLVNRFIAFSKIFGFYEEYKDEINKHLNTPYFDPIKKHESENSSLSDEIAKALIDIMNTGIDEDKIKSSETFYEYQAEKVLYTKTWRDFQQVVSTLTSEQNAISEELLGKIKKDKSIKKLIKGGPGTGKTLILINILQETPDKDIKLLTYTKSLTSYNKYLSKLISFNGKKLSDSDKEKVSNKILSFDDYFTSVAEKICKKKIIPLSSVPDVRTICDKYNIKKKDYLFKEAKEIWLHLPDQKKYIDHTYSQAKAVDKSKQKVREIYWNAVADLSKVFELVDFSFVPLEWGLYKIYKKEILIPEKFKCDYLLIDEIQDLEAAKIEAIKQLSRKGYIFAGDKTQSVFVRKGLPWGWLKKQELSTTKGELTTNFRSTRPIQDLANSYREVITLKDTEVISKGFMPGPIPEAYVSKKETDIMEKILERIQFMKEQLFFDNGEFCIVGANDIIISKIKDKLSEKGIECKSIESSDYDFAEFQNAVKLSKIKYVKGIDIPVIILVLDESFIDCSGEKNDGLDIYSQENSIYTCISRAMNILNVFFIDTGTLLMPAEDSKKNNAVLKLYETMKDNIVTL